VRAINQLAAVGVIALSALAARAEEWPKWLGPREDGISRATGLLDKWPEAGPRQVWAVSSIGIGYSSPVGLDGRIYLFTLDDQAKRDVLTCFNADTGKVIWQESYANGYTADYKGTRATPLIDGQFIYTYGGNGQLTCRNLADGKLIWQTSIMQETGGQNLRWGLASTPLLYNGKLHVQAGANAPILVAVDQKTGKIAWESEKGLGGYAHPILADVDGRKQMIAFGGNAVWGFDADTGKTLWKEKWETRYDVNAMTPVYRNGLLFVSSAYDRGCMMLRLTATGAEKLWENKNMKAHFQPVLFEDGVLYGNSQGTLTCLDWATGEIKWQNRDTAMRLGNGGSINRVGDKLITMSERAKLSLLKADPQGFEVISQVDRLFDGNHIWSTPLIYRGRLYCKGTDELVCLDISGK
jgi:outer membrane protein assembly factor BamB